MPPADPRRHGASPGPWAELNARGVTFAGVSDWAGASQAFEEAASALSHEALHGGPTDALALVLSNLANACARDGRMEAAIEHAQRALTLRESLAGASSPVAARTRMDLAVMLASAGAVGEARTLLDAAMTQLERVYGADDVRLVGAVENATRMALLAGEHERAGRELRRLRGLLERHELPTDRLGPLAARLDDAVGEPMAPDQEAGNAWSAADAALDDAVLDDAALGDTVFDERPFGGQSVPDAPLARGDEAVPDWTVPSLLEDAPPSTADTPAQSLELEPLVWEPEETPVFDWSAAAGIELGLDSGTPPLFGENLLGGQQDALDIDSGTWTVDDPGTAVFPSLDTGGGGWDAEASALAASGTAALWSTALDDGAEPAPDVEAPEESWRGGAPAPAPASAGAAGSAAALDEEPAWLEDDTFGQTQPLDDDLPWLQDEAAPAPRASRLLEEPDPEIPDFLRLDSRDAATATTPPAGAITAPVVPPPVVAPPPAAAAAALSMADEAGRPTPVFTTAYGGEQKVATLAPDAPAQDPAEDEWGRSGAATPHDGATAVSAAPLNKYEEILLRVRKQALDDRRTRRARPLTTGRIVTVSLITVVVVSLGGSAWWYLLN